MKAISWKWLLLLLLPVALLPFCAIVPDDGMAPSLLPGDIILLLPIKPAVGDTVAVVDPLEPQRWTLRRLAATDGTIRYEQGMLLTSEPQKILEMGRENGVVIVKEGPHLAQHLAVAVDWDMEELTIPEGTAFLSADNREKAVDSRWWGTMPLETIQAVVLLRIGPPGHRWRSWAAWRP